MPLAAFSNEGMTTVEHARDVQVQSNQLVTVKYFASFSKTIMQGSRCSERITERERERDRER